MEEHSHSRGSGGSIKRELHKASVAQELSDAVLDLMMMSGSEWGLAGTYQVRCEDQVEHITVQEGKWF